MTEVQPYGYQGKGARFFEGADGKRWFFVVTVHPELGAGVPGGRSLRPRGRRPRLGLGRMSLACRVGNEESAERLAECSFVVHQPCGKVHQKRDWGRGIGSSPEPLLLDVGPGFI